MLKLNRFFFVVTVNLVVFLALLVALEWGYRLFDNGDAQASGSSNLAMVEAHPTRVWWYKPNFNSTVQSEEFTMNIRTNSRRLRSAENTESDLTILAIGDSFTFGWGVQEEQRYSEQLARAIQSRFPGRRVSVVNAGHWMYTFDQQLLTLAELVELHKPDLVVQGWYWPHARTILGHEWKLRDGVVAKVNAPGVFVDDKGVLRFRHDFLMAPPFGSRLLAEIARSWLNYRLVGESATSDLDLLDEHNPDAEVAWNRTREMIRQTGEMVRRLDVAYIAFGIPRDVLVSKSEWRGHEELLHDKDLDLPDRRFAQWFEASGLNYVNMTLPFRRDYTNELYFPIDPHWAAAGHKLAADILLAPALSKLALN